MVKYKIIDNFLSKSYYKGILEILSSSNFAWGYYENITGTQLEPQQHFNGYGFTNTFWYKQPIGQFGTYLEPLLLQIMDVSDCDSILRARVDMVTWSKEDFIHPVHIDFPFPNTATIFYINETDGDTIFYNVKSTAVLKDKELKEYDRVSPKANRLVIFDGDLLHTGCSPTKHKNRILINSNYIKKEHLEEVNAWMKKRENRTL